MGKALAKSDYVAAATELGCEVAVLQAVAEVEAAGSGFDRQGRLKLRFEGHIFRRQTQGRYDRTYPAISYPYKQHAAKEHGYEAFNEAMSVNEDAAMESCSWGKFQIMGYHYEMLGFESVGAFVDFLKEGEANQLECFVRWVMHEGLDDELRRHDWAGFARRYNGADYRTNRYDKKLAAAYAKFSGNNSAPRRKQTFVPQLDDDAPGENDASETTTLNEGQVAIDNAANVVALNATNKPLGQTPDEPATQITTNGMRRWWGEVIGTGGLGLAGLKAALDGEKTLLIVACAAVGLIIVALIFRKTISEAVNKYIASDPNRFNVR